MPTHLPTTWLSPIPGLARQEGHRYRLNGLRFLASVTTVTSTQKSDYALQKIMETRHLWEPRGNSCHRALELWLAGNSSEHVPFTPADLEELHDLEQGDHRDWIAPLLSHDRWNQIQVIASERPTCCIRRRVVGTFDLAYIDESGRRILADLKSLGSAKGSTYSTAAQLGGYMALEATWGNAYDAGQTIWCRPGSTTFSPLYSVQECRLAWAGAWAAWRARPPAPF